VHAEYFIVSCFYANEKGFWFPYSQTKIASTIQEIRFYFLAITITIAISTNQFG
jgi:hypothetical protein